MNSTACARSLLYPSTACFPSDFPWYYTPKPTIFSGISDHTTVIFAPILAYWVLSLFFHALDISGWKWLEKYRIHESEQVQKLNRATRLDVVKAVLFQQAIQAILAFLCLDEGKGTGVGHADSMGAIALRLEPVVEATLGRSVWVTSGAQIAWFTYWWAIPTLQFFFAMFIIDTWQYFLHRAMHVNKFMYKHVHSVHHRLYVPYAFGSLYNHPVEGFLLDSLGCVLAETLSAMTTRQSILLFTISTFKTVDDHCGYRFPFDPLQMVTSNNADYHDIHHQPIGIKSNFSQPFFVHWDVLLGTRLTRKDIEKRRMERKEKDL